MLTRALDETSFLEIEESIYFFHSLLIQIFAMDVAFIFFHASAITSQLMQTKKQRNFFEQCK